MRSAIDLPQARSVGAAAPASGPDAARIYSTDRTWVLIVLILRIRQAECALADGRLEEACDLVQRAEIREHRRGQALVSRLLDRLVERGQAHLTAGRSSEALADGERAARLGGDQPRIAALHAEAVAALTRQQRHGRERRDGLQAAGDRVAGGDLSGAARQVERLADPGRTGGALLDRIAARRGQADGAARAAQAALERDDLEAAAGAVMNGREAHPAHAQLVELAGAVAERLATMARGELASGRLDRAEALLERLRTLAPDALAVNELSQVVAQCRRVAWWIEQGDIDRAAPAVERLASLMPDAGWLSEAAAAARGAAEARATLLSGPLGLMAWSPATRVDPHATHPIASASRHDHASRRPVETTSTRPCDGSALPMRFGLQIDGIGSFLVVQGARVTLGPVSASRRPDVALLAPANLPAALIERVDEDLFLRTDGAVQVNGTAVTSRLLSDGDRITLGPRCSMRFRQPNPATATALLELSAARLPRADARTVVLLSDAMVLGPGRSAHLRADALAEPIVLHVHDGVLCWRPQHGPAGHGGTADGATPIVMGRPTRVGPLRMVVTEWTGR